MTGVPRRDGTRRGKGRTGMPGSSRQTRRLRLILGLVAAHSTAVGIGLLIAHPTILRALGFQAVGEPFFPSQGGIFHIVMAVAYTLPALHPARFEPFILLAVIAKTMATLFLIGYWLLVDPIWSVLLSGIGDLLMGALILVVWLSWRRVSPEGGGEEGRA
jgi:hypothetical protein